MNLTRLVPYSHTIGLPIAGCLFCLLCLAMAGCGSKSEEQKVVTPPEPTGETKPDSSTTDPPGAIELPPGDIPKDATPDQKGTGGLELPDTLIKPATDDPADVEVKPDDTNTSAKPTAKVQYATWQEIEKRATSTGQITVVDVWSTVCEPCIKEFPGLVKLHKERGASIQCISVDVDFYGGKTRPPQHYEPTVVGFLTHVGAEFPNYICSTPSDEVFTALDIDSIPAVLIYDADGKLIKRFIDAGDTVGFTYEKDIVPFLDKLTG